MTEYRRILLDGAAVQVVRHGDTLVAADGREVAAADAERIAWLEAGDHARVIDTMPEFLRVRPEAKFAHYLMMAAALGGRTVRAPGRPFSDYENSVGTGQVHLWFDRPTAGWSSGG